MRNNTKNLYLESEEIEEDYHADQQDPVMIVSAGPRREIDYAESDEEEKCEVIFYSEGLSNHATSYYPSAAENSSLTHAANKRQGREQHVSFLGYPSDSRRSINEVPSDYLVQQSYCGVFVSRAIGCCHTASKANDSNQVLLSGQASSLKKAPRD